jgi:hypothetical protein
MKLIQLNTQVHKELSLLSLLYSNLCEYAHTSTVAHATLLSQLNSLPCLTEQDLNSCIDQSIQILNCMVAILILIHKQEFNKFSTIKQKEIVETWSSKKREKFGIIFS